jgi:phage-related protein
VLAEAASAELRAFSEANQPGRASGLVSAHKPIHRSRPPLISCTADGTCARIGASDENQVKETAGGFYRTPAGAEPVRDWLNGLPQEDRRVLGHDIREVEFGWPVGMPLCRSLGDGLWEVRSNLPSNKIARVFFCAAQGRMVLLHGFVKRTQKTPKSDLELARKRQKEI